MVARQTRTRRSALKTSAGAFVLAAVANTLLGCSVAPADLKRWEQTSEGPKRLSAVILYDKYPSPLRVEAAMSLIEMKPQKGQRVGIERLVKGAFACDSAWMERKSDEPCSKASLSPETRAKLLEGLVPRIIEELKKPSPPPAQNGQVAPDPSYKYKDAAQLLLTYDKTPIVADAALKEQLLGALRDWAMVDFNRKLNDQTQMFGMEQLLRLIGPTSVENLPALMDRNVIRDLTKMADLIDKLGDAKTKEQASKKLVEIMTYVASEQWRKDNKDNEDQEGTMTKVFVAMKKVGGASVTGYCLALAGEKSRNVKLRTGALNVLENRIEKKDTASIKKLADLTKAKDAPLPVVDAAFRLLKQLPREAVITSLFQLLDVEDWKVRRLAGATILQMSKVENIAEFMTELGKRAKHNFNPAEARTYAAYLAELKEGTPLEKLKPYFKDEAISARVTALSYYLVSGSKHDVAALKPFGDDKDKVPKCDEKDKNECTWTCIVVGADKKEQSKIVETVGDFVTYCVLPQLANREPKKLEKLKEKPADSPKESAGAGGG